MSTVTIRKLNRDEIGAAAYRLATYAFSPSPPLPDRDEYMDRVTKRGGTTFFAAFEDDLPQALAGSHAMTQNVRSKIFPISGLFAVVSHPSVRRRGLARKVIDALQAEMRDTGLSFSLLYPFRESFYERLGYVPFPQPRYVKFVSSSLEPLLKQELGGHVEVALNTENQAEYIAFTRQLQSKRHGMAIFDVPPPTLPERYQLWIALAKADGKTIGAAVYSIEGSIITQFTMRIHNFYYSTPQGRFLLLEWIARHLGQASEVELWLAPDEFPETWHPDLEYSYGIVTKPPMGRVLDVAQIGGMKTGPGRFTARICDPFCPWNEGVWIFATDNGGLTVQPGGQAQCELTIQGLSALIYGVNDPAEFHFRGWGEPSMVVQKTMRDMFPRMTPYIHEKF